MLSPRIDLTEHRDFSGGNGALMDTPIEIPMDEYELMSNEEYEVLVWWEGIFGKRRHYTEKSKVFHTESDYPFGGDKDHCYHCGKLFRLPWDNIYGRCRKCSEEKEESGYRWRIPWVDHYTRPSSREDVAYNLFNRR